MSENARNFLKGAIRPSFYRQAERYLLWLGLIIVALHGYIQDLHRSNYMEKHLTEEKVESHRIEDIERDISDMRRRMGQCEHMRLPKAPVCK